MPIGPSGGTTVTFAALRASATVTTPPIAPGSGFDEELRKLLRSRLILVHLLALTFLLLLVVLSFLIPGRSQEAESSSRPDQGNPWNLAGPVFQCVAGALILWRQPGMSLWSLRLWEIILFAVQAIYNGALRFMLLSTAVVADTDLSTVSIGGRGVVTITGFVTLILAYGVLIPNSPRRSLIGVLSLTTVPFLALGFAVLANPGLRPHFFALSAQAAVTLVFPAAIAVFASARASALQRRAFDAEKRANEIGQYSLKQKLGEGGMGEVWLAEHRLLKRPCAVKFIRAELAANPSTVARFEREVQAVTTLTHFNTIRVYDYGRADDGSFYYVMEYLEGPTLESLVKRAGPLEPGRVVYLLRQLCGALAEAHTAGLIHRDVKPGNVIVATLGGQHDVVKLLDFGLVQDLATADNRLTAAGMVLGTPAYMCPEQAAGSVAVDARGDIYSLGAVAFFALTGRPPFDRTTIGEYLTAHLTQSAPDVRDLMPEIPADLAAIVARCLAKQSTERFQSAAQLDRALAACACTSEWSGLAAAGWWANHRAEARPKAGPPTATFAAPEALRT